MPWLQYQIAPVFPVVKISVNAEMLNADGQLHNINIQVSKHSRTIPSSCTYPKPKLASFTGNPSRGVSMWYEGMFHTCPFSFPHHSTRHGPGQAAVPRAHTKKVLNSLAPCPSPHQGIHGRDVPHPSQIRAEGSKEQCHNLDLKSGLRSHLLGRTAAGSEIQK